ncbi:unnamed protein product [Amoebophrya sp. A120]|nr:unnamed protein product [Amoebophrya sp. A120]|eukprot:GSA120T00001937001.1
MPCGGVEDYCETVAAGGGGVPELQNERRRGESLQLLVHGRDATDGRARGWNAVHPDGPAAESTELSRTAKRPCEIWRTSWPAQCLSRRFLSSSSFNVLAQQAEDGKRAAPSLSCLYLAVSFLSLSWLSLSGSLISFSLYPLFHPLAHPETCDGQQAELAHGLSAGV